MYQGLQEDSIFRDRAEYVSVFKWNPQPVHKSVSACLRSLSVGLSDLAENALAELGNLAAGEARGTALTIDYCLKSGDTITSCLLLPPNDKPPGSYLLLGDLQPVGSTPKADPLENFKPTTSLEIFQLLSNLNFYASALQASGTQDMTEIVEPILVRALTLADSIAFVYRFVAAELLPRLAKNMPGSQEEQTKLAQDYVSSVGRHAQVIAATLKDLNAAEQLTRGCMINLPTCLTFPLARNQRCLNGMYFPSEVEDVLIKKLAESQARTIADRG